MTKIVSGLISGFKNLRLELQQKGFNQMSFTLKNWVILASTIDREPTNQGILPVGHSLDVKLLKLLHVGSFSPSFSSRFIR